MRVVVVQWKVRAGVQEQAQGEPLEEIAARGHRRAQGGQDQREGMQGIENRLDGRGEVVLAPYLALRNSARAWKVCECVAGGAVRIEEGKALSGDAAVSTASALIAEALLILHFNKTFC